jgi:galactonate dehydratase
MKRRQFLGSAAAAMAASRATGESRHALPASLCDCTFQTQTGPVGTEAFRDHGSKVRITNVKVFGVSFSPASDRPYVFVKLETNAGLIGWGEGTLEGKAGAVMACVNDFRDFLIGADPHHRRHAQVDEAHVVLGGALGELTEGRFSSHSIATAASAGTTASTGIR